MSDILRIDYLVGVATELPTVYVNSVLYQPHEVDRGVQASIARIKSEAAEKAWDEGRTHGYQDAQAHHGQGVQGEGCGPDSWDCTCTNPYRALDGAHNPPKEGK